MQNFINSVGGIVPAMSIVLVSVNVLLSAIQTICNNLKVQEPSVIQKIASVIASIIPWLSANVATVPAPSSSNQNPQA